jgi:ferric-dicitrate binding protein FerR (iron transport regulator)
MHRKRFTELFHVHRRGKTETLSEIIEDSLQANTERLHAIDPETERQWQRLHRTLTERQYSAGAQPLFVSRRFVWPAVSLAAAIVLIIAGTILIRSNSARTYITARGQESTVALPDGSEVILNHASALTYSHSLFERTRRVSLNGEAFFHIHNNGTPFIIATDAGTVQVLGTQFNVRARDRSLEVGVVSGSVKLKNNSNGIDSSIVLAKEQFAVCAANAFPEIRSDVPRSGSPAWLHGQFMFYHTSLLAACEEIASHFDVNVRVDGRPIPEETITGTIDNTNIETTLAALARLMGKNYRHEGTQYILY